MTWRTLEVAKTRHQLSGGADTFVPSYAAATEEEHSHWQTLENKLVKADQRFHNAPPI